MDLKSLHEWIDHGVKAGFCEPAACCSHDLLMNDEEVDRFEDGWDPCIFVLKLKDTQPDTNDDAVVIELFAKLPE